MEKHFSSHPILFSSSENKGVGTAGHRQQFLTKVFENLP
jgi:hypothetical protein